MTHRIQALRHPFACLPLVHACLVCPTAVPLSILARLRQRAARGRYTVSCWYQAGMCSCLHMLALAGSICCSDRCLRMSVSSVPGAAQAGEGAPYRLCGSVGSNAGYSLLRSWLLCWRLLLLG